MFLSSFESKVKESKLSIVAIGFIHRDDPNLVTIIGSGFVLSKKENQIISCYHIIDPANLNPADIPNLRALVPVKQGGEIRHYDWLLMRQLEVDKANDLGIYEVDNLSTSLAEEIRLGDSDEVREGNQVYFIGYPYAALIRNEGWGYTEILNTGVISTIKFDAQQKRTFILVDAINNPGNSGCPLILRKNNRVIGVMTNAFRKQSEVPQYSNLDIREPMHFGGARPINFVKELLEKHRGND